MPLRGIIAALAESITGLISPNVCRICGQTLVKDERLMCLGCQIQLPRTYAHHDSFNEIHRRLGHHQRVDQAAAWFHYKKDTPYAHMLIDAKYADRPLIDRQLGEAYARELIADNFFDGIDMLVPMPMYWTKRLTRGYNQAEEICKGISKVTGIKIVKALKAERSHGIQSRHNRAKRFSSITGTMAVTDASAIKGKSILLVDDIITSGASCVEALRAIGQAAPASVNVLALGLTDRTH